MQSPTEERNGTCMAEYNLVGNVYLFKLPNINEKAYTAGRKAAIRNLLGSEA